jgi:hypothetical protein
MDSNKTIQDGLIAVCNGQMHPLLLEISEGPWFSWKFSKNVPADFLQTAYQIIVDTQNKVIWDSGKIESASQFMIPYNGPDLSEFGIYSASISAFGAGGEGAFGKIDFETGVSGGTLG